MRVDLPSRVQRGGNRLTDETCRLHIHKNAIMEARMTRRWFTAVTAVLISTMSLSLAVTADEMPSSWDGLVAVKAKRMDAVYLMPGADFRAYTKVIFDPTEVALRKDWLRDYNRSTGSLSQRITDADVQKAFEKVRSKFSGSFSKAYSKAGYQVVTTPGPDVLRVRTGVVNLSFSAPDKRSGACGHSPTRPARQHWCWRCGFAKRRLDGPRGRQAARRHTHKCECATV